ncbi:MAG: hypothetical protein GY855_14385 [candidate division Zixibacteria bacterium]|nr:hypothetical protein [candidate division Zixibacteria bacterium]
MVKKEECSYQDKLIKFDREFFTGKEKFTYMGGGSIGGKAHGLARMKEIIEEKDNFSDAEGVKVNIPTLTVIATDFFDQFMEENDLYKIALSDKRNDQKSLSFQKASLPAQLVGDLRALIAQVHTPLAIRSSSMLEDAMFEPFASVYATKMIPNNQVDVESRFKKLVEAVKFIYASTFFNDAANYIQATRHKTTDEKMAVIIQEVVGARHNDRFYPNICGVARSYNFYPSGSAKSEEGVIDMALGLGKTIVDDGVAWSYSPYHPDVNPPFKSMDDLLKHTQTRFWAVNMGKPPAYNPIKETEYMFRYDLADAEYDHTLRFIASTLRPNDGRMIIGTGIKGPRVLDFAPVLKLDDIPINKVMKKLLKLCEEKIGSLVEIEFAVTLDKQHGTPARIGFLQVRPMVVSHDEVDVSDSELEGQDVLLASDKVLGNGTVSDIRDIVYIKEENFNAQNTLSIVPELETLNHKLVSVSRPYLLIGFGRWGTTDPVAGIPINFGQISGAKVIVEATLPEMNFMLSQGSHFFHNVTSFQLQYFSIYHWGKYKIDWDWLNKQNAELETDYIRHVRLDSPLLIKVNGKDGKGVVKHG